MHGTKYTFILLHYPIYNTTSAHFITKIVGYYAKTHIHPEIKAVTDTGYQGIRRIHNKSEMPKKKSKKNPLTKEEKKNNRKLASDRVVNENVIGMLKHFGSVHQTVSF